MLPNFQIIEVLYYCTIENIVFLYIYIQMWAHYDTIH